MKFIIDTHSYISDNDEKYESITSLIKRFKQPFDEIATAVKVSRKKTSKWYGKKPDEIRAAWKAEADRAANLGIQYHKMREKALLSCTDIIYEKGFNLRVTKTPEEGNIKYALPQKLIDGIYPEHIIYLDGAKKAGQADRVDVLKGIINITDYKTYKELKTEGYRMWNGKTKKMLGKLRHLDDINFNHSAIQLSCYMFMIMKHNPQLIPGQMFIEHIIFEEEQEKDEYGFPLIKYDVNGPIVKEIRKVEVPYLKFEAEKIIYDSKNI